MTSQKITKPIKPTKQRGKSYYDCWDLVSWFKEHKNVDIEPYLTKEYHCTNGGNGILLSIFLEDDLDENSCEAQKVMHEVFQKEIEVKFWW